MARIYISYSHADKGEVLKLTNALRALGHDILMDTEVMKVGQDFRKTLLSALRSSDGALVYITENSINSTYVISEIGSARAFVEETANKKFLIPVVSGDIDIPHIIQDLYCVKLADHTFDQAIDLINLTISNAVGRKEAAEDREEKVRELIESNAAKYISEAMSELKVRERNNRIIGNVWYIIGFLALVSGIIYAILGLESLKDLDKDYLLYAIVFLKSLIIVGLLITCAKYGFDLGKTYMNESLRNSDRIHAISFGRFYLQAFGDRISSPEEIKDIFQNWNIDKDSAFQKLESSSFDPKMYDKLLEILNNISSKDKS